MEREKHCSLASLILHNMNLNFSWTALALLSVGIVRKIFTVTWKYCSLTSRLLVLSCVRIDPSAAKLLRYFKIFITGAVPPALIQHWTQNYRNLSRLVLGSGQQIIGACHYFNLHCAQLKKVQLDHFSIPCRILRMWTFNISSKSWLQHRSDPESCTAVTRCQVPTL